jgi:hypothetical protein
MWKDSRKKHTFGYGVRPVFQIALGFPDSLCLEHFHKVTGWGQICPNRKSGHYWVVRDHDELSELLELLKRHVRFPSTLKKIALITEFLSIMPGKRPCTTEIWKRELEIIVELRKMTKRKLNPKRHNAEAILSTVTPDGPALEAMVEEREPRDATLILKVDGGKSTLGSKS